MPSTKHENNDLDFNDNASSHDGDDVMSKTGKRRYFPSNIPESYVRNAQYGTVYPYKVGSFESLRLYRVADCTGSVDKQGFKIRRYSEPNRDTNFLYYDTPEQYSRHRRVNIDPNRMAEWHSLVARLFPDGKFSKAAHTSWMNERQYRASR